MPGRSARLTCCNGSKPNRPEPVAPTQMLLLATTGAAERCRRPTSALAPVHLAKIDCRCSTHQRPWSIPAAGPVAQRARAACPSARRPTARPRRPAAAQPSPALALGLGRSGRMCQLAASPPPPHHGAHQHHAHSDDKFIAVHPDASWPCLAVCPTSHLHLADDQCTCCICCTYALK